MSRPEGLDRLQSALLPAADLFMIVMLSRPESGSLRNTRVTAASIWLASAFALVCLGLAGTVVAAAALSPWLRILLVLLLAALGLGSACLALFGIRQRAAS